MRAPNFALEIPPEAKRDYFIYLLDYGWDEPIGKALMANYERMASIAAENRAVVIRGTHRVHFEDEVLSWHHINGENAEDLLPAILITNRHPVQFKESFGNQHARIEKDLKLIMIPLKKNLQNNYRCCYNYRKNICRCKGEERSHRF